MPKKIKVLIAVLVPALILGAFFWFSQDGHLVIFDPKGIIAEQESNLIITATLLMLSVIIPVYFILFFILYKYRDGKSASKYQPNVEKNIGLQIVMWLIPSAVIFCIGTLIWRTTHELDPYKKLNSTVKPITIQVVALNWKWLFIYPEENIATINYIKFPENTPINFQLTADAPMNTFWIPQLAGQVYAMAGMRNELSLMANEKGEYDGFTSEINGKGYSGMRFKAVATSPEDYRVWLGSVKASALMLDEETYKKLVEDSENNKVIFYSAVKNNLFNEIMMKFMMPAEEGEKNMHHNMNGMKN